MVLGLVSLAASVDTSGRATPGLLALCFASVLIAADHTLSAREVVGVTVIAAAFGLFALFGPGPAERLLAVVFGIGDVPAEGQSLSQIDGEQR